MDELMQRDEDALVQQRLHADRLRRGSTVVEASRDERKVSDIEMDGQNLPSRSRTETSRDEGSPESKRTRTEASGSTGDDPPARSEKRMETAPDDAETRRDLKNISRIAR